MIILYFNNNRKTGTVVCVCVHATNGKNRHIIVVVLIATFIFIYFCCWNDEFVFAHIRFIFSSPNKLVPPIRVQFKQSIN